MPFLKISLFHSAVDVNNIRVLLDQSLGLLSSRACGSSTCQEVLSRALTH